MTNHAPGGVGGGANLDIVVAEPGRGVRLEIRLDIKLDIRLATRDTA